MLLFQPEVIAQSRISLSGYSEVIPMYQYFKENLPEYYNTDKNIFLNLSRNRFRSSLDLWRDAKLNAEYEIDILYNSSTSSIDDNSIIIPNRQLVKMNWKPVNEKNLSVFHNIDRVYLRQNFDKFNIIAGRQRISWGTGRIWNPTDLFNPINPVSFYLTEKSGADAISAKYAFGNFTDLNLVFNPQEKIGNSNYGFRFRTNYHLYDFSVMGGYFDKRIIAGMDFAGNLFDAGLRGEGIISADKNDLSENFIKFILGMDNQFTPKLYALIEYHYNGEGTTDKNKYDFTRLAKGEIQNLSKNYICLSTIYQIFPLININLTDITNLNDKSGFLNINSSVSATDNLTLGLGAQMTYGTEKNEYWYFPFSVYLQGRYDF